MMLEPMDSPDVKEFWEYYLDHTDQFIRDRYPKEKIYLACFKAGMECQKKKLIVRKPT